MFHTSPERSLIRKQIEHNIQTRAIATLQKTKMTKPIMSPEVEEQVLSAVSQYKDRGKWRSWGLSHYRKAGACVLLWGPPGTGKTVIARYLANRAGMGLREFDLSTFGSRTPGENERTLEAIFNEANEKKMALFMDEADSILWDRSKATDNQWMVAIINKILSLISGFKHLLVMATNRKQDLDPALASRLIADVEVARPTYEMRLLLWKAKIPSLFPVQPTTVQLQELANLDLSGREIENAVVGCAGKAIYLRKVPTFEMLCNVAKAEEGRVQKMSLDAHE